MFREQFFTKLGTRELAGESESKTDLDFTCGTSSQHISFYNLACKPQLHVNLLFLTKMAWMTKSVCGELRFLTKEIFISFGKASRSPQSL